MGEVQVWDIIVAFAPGVATFLVTWLYRRFKSFRIGAESPLRRAYWNTRLDERIAQAKEWKTPRTRRRVDAALNHLEADEAMQWYTLPSSVPSWIFAIIAYAGALVVRLQLPGWWGVVIAIGVGGVGVWMQIEAMNAPQRRRELRSVLASIAGSGPAGHELVTRAPEDVIGVWSAKRKEIKKSVTTINGLANGVRAAVPQAVTNRLLAEVEQTERQ